jgi:hypothetical protein
MKTIREVENVEGVGVKIFQKIYEEVLQLIYSIHVRK